MATQAFPTAAEAMPPRPSLTPEQEWLAGRRLFVGGSEAHMLLNEPQYGKGCVRALAYQKLGVEPDYPEVLDDALMTRGKVLEPLVASMYENETKRKLRCDSFDANGMPKVRLHPKHPHAGVHVDRIVLAGYGDVTETGTAEIKTHGEGPYWNIKRNGLSNGHLLQIQWGQWVKGHPWGPFIILGVFGGLPLMHFDVPHDKRIDDIFAAESDKFADLVWGKGQLPDRPLPAEDPRCKACAWRMECRGEEIDAATAKAFAEMKEGKKTLVQIDNADLARALVDRDTVANEIKALTNEKADDPGLKQQIDARVQKALEQAGVPVGGGAYVVGYGKVYRMASQANYLDAKALKAKHPEIYEEFFVSKRTGDSFLRTYPQAQ